MRYAFRVGLVFWVFLAAVSISPGVAEAQGQGECHAAQSCFYGCYYFRDFQGYKSTEGWGSRSSECKPDDCGPCTIPPLVADAMPAPSAIVEALAATPSDQLSQILTAELRGRVLVHPQRRLVAVTDQCSGLDIAAVAVLPSEKVSVLVDLGVAPLGPFLEARDQLPPVRDQQK